MDKRFDPQLQPELDEKHTINRFKGKLAVVTGGASGIGFATVYRLAHDGATVLILDIDDVAGKVSEEYFMDNKNTKVLFRKCDVTSSKQCSDVISSLVNEIKQNIDILVNAAVKFVLKGDKEGIVLQNCAVYLFQHSGVDNNDWSSCSAVNVMGPANVVQACIPHFNKDSSVVNFSSTQGSIANPGKWIYCSNKAAVCQLTKCMALDLAKNNIRVNSVAPGRVWSPVLSKLAPHISKEEHEQATVGNHLIPKLCETSQIASVVAFLCSKDASYITGANIPVDGGYTAMGPEGKEISFPK